MRKSYFEERSKSRKVRGIWPALLSPPRLSLQVFCSPRVGSALPVLLIVSRLPGEPVSVPRRSGAHGGLHGQRWVVAAAEERWGRFRRLCNLTHSLRLHGSDEQSVLLPKLISPAPSSLHLLPFPPTPPAGLMAWICLFMQTRPGWGAWCAGPAAPTRRAPEPLSRAPCPL